MPRTPRSGAPEKILAEQMSQTPFPTQKRPPHCGSRLQGQTLNPGPWETLFFSTPSLILPPTKHAAGSEGALWPTVFSPQPTATRLKAPCSRMPHHADPATPGPRVTGPTGLSTEFSWGGRMPSPRGWTPMSAHFEAAPSQNSQTRVLPMSQDRGLSVFNQSMVMTEPRV